MKKNMGTADRTIRAILGIAALVAALLFVEGVWDVVLYIFGAAILITVALGVCPLYIPFNISTK